MEKIKKMPGVGYKSVLDDKIHSKEFNDLLNLDNFFVTYLLEYLNEAKINKSKSRSPYTQGLYDLATKRPKFDNAYNKLEDFLSKQLLIQDCINKLLSKCTQLYKAKYGGIKVKYDHKEYKIPKSLAKAFKEAENKALRKMTDKLEDSPNTNSIAKSIMESLALSHSNKSKGRSDETQHLYNFANENKSSKNAYDILINSYLSGRLRILEAQKKCDEGKNLRIKRKKDKSIVVKNTDTPFYKRDLEVGNSSVFEAINDALR
ncbi:MAG: hypothetical protein EP298_05425 [Gammaproteobacteria bacterium]|nr:MAG: hypothetical protein EP298_05425 [Gammaproteobacteria bacterium]UTW43238.1 hypothetical protein KFE69_03590 [bacterium SCSIO 12844]